MNNAIVAPQYSGLPSGLPAYFSTLNGAEFDNQWIYLSGDGGTNPSQYNGHGMLFWFTFGTAKLGGATDAQALAAALGVASKFPSGEMWRHNDIFAPNNALSIGIAE